MKVRSNIRILSTLRSFAKAASIFCIVIGVTVMMGWVFNVGFLKSILPSLATMKANSALAFILCALSLWSLTDEKQPKSPIRFITWVCATSVVLIAILTLGEYLLDRNLGVDQFLFQDHTTPKASFPGRMSPATALNFLLIGCALLLFNSRLGVWLSELPTVVALIIAGVAAIGYIYGVSSLYQIGIYSSMALHTALTFILLCLGILLARPAHGLISIFTDEGMAGILARRLLPAAIGIPSVLGWLFLTWQRLGHYDDTAFGFALFALSNVIIFSTLIWMNARAVHQEEVGREQAETALGLSEQRAHALIENSWDAIALFGADGVILYGSPSTPQILGYSLDEFVGRNAFELIHKEDQALVMERLTMSLQRPGEHISVYARVRHKNGEWRWLEGVFTNLMHEPSVQAIVNNYHDFTERKEAEAALQQMYNELERQVQERTAALSQSNVLLQMLLDYMPDHIYFKDAQSRFIRNSRSQARALGLRDPAEAIGKTDFDFFPHAQLSYEIEQEIIKSGKPLVDQEERVVWPDGQETWVLTTKVPLLDQAGQIIGTFGISRDITERKRAEAAMQKAKLELEAANKELEAFSYSVSHDLRAPLRSIDGFSQALLEDYADQLPAEGQDHLKRVRAATQRMAQLIDDLLNLSKVTRAPMKLVSVDLSQLARGIVAELQQTQPERSVDFNIAPNLKALGDPSLLQAMLENLLNNAWKYSSKQEHAQIEFGSKHENNEIIYFVRDNGAGFDMAYAGKLFGAFQRLHAIAEFPGTGVGLATVQRIVHRHGGHIWAESAVNQGATFFFTLPVLERAQLRVEPKEKDTLARRVKEII